MGISTSIANLSIETNETTIKLISRGNWLADNLHNVFKQLNNIKINQKLVHVSWDFSAIDRIDSTAIVLLVKFLQRFDHSKVSFSITGLTAKYQRMLIFYRKNAVFDKPEKPSKHSFLEGLGRKFLSVWSGFMQFLQFLGESTYNFIQILLHPSLFRFKSTIKHIETSGFRALPIIGLTAFLIGLVIAYQSAEQLARFGANIFIVEMVSISVFRELAPLISAIVVAGRSASAYTAEIGTMKITEEIDAMRTMGFDPYQFLVLPRMFALIISMPLIVFFADMVGVFGGMIIARFELGITFGEFIARLQTEVPLKHILIGLIKAPFFGFIIASIGAFRGFQVTGSTDSIGHYTTVSVVNAIFWVIASNALISVLLTEIGI